MRTWLIVLITLAALVLIFHENVIVQALGNLAWALVTLVSVLGRFTDPSVWLTGLPKP